MRIGLSISKDEIKSRLNGLGIELFEYRADPEYIAKAMLQTTIDSSILHKLYLKGKNPRLSFLDFAKTSPEVQSRMLDRLTKNNCSSSISSPIFGAIVGNFSYTVSYSMVSINARHSAFNPMPVGCPLFTRGPPLEMQANPFQEIIPNPAVSASPLESKKKYDLPANQWSLEFFLQELDAAIKANDGFTSSRRN